MKIFFLLLFFVPWDIFAQELPAPLWPIISDYGPRNYGGYKWHWGIDYDGNMWNPIQAIESGNIVGITHSSDGWYLRVYGSKYWTYFHVFNNETLPIISSAPVANRYELRSAILENPVSHSVTPSPENIIILWVDRINNNAEKILSPRNGWLVQTGISTAPYIMASSTWAVTSNAVKQGDIIAPVGNSGVVPVPPGDGSHLHLACSSNLPAFPLFYDINPLYYIRHDEPYYGVSVAALENAPLFHISGAAESAQAGERVWGNIYSDMGLDFDRAELFLQPMTTPPASWLYNNESRAAKIVYGGASSR